MKNSSIRKICHIALFSALIAVCAQIAIPLPIGVPLSLQTFGVMLAGVMLGAKGGVAATLVYIILGAIGVPVFANFTGGFERIVGITGGFILSFPLLALAAGIGASRKNKIWFIVWLAIGILINHACGVLMFAFRTPAGINFANLIYTFTLASAPFLPGDAVKAAIAIIISRRWKFRWKF